MVAFEDRLGRSLDAPEDSDRALALLYDASAAARAYTGQHLSESSTTERLRVRKAHLRLPQRPVTAVTGVTAVDGTAVEYEWVAGDRVSITGLSDVMRFDVEPFRSTTPYLDVTYTHGYNPVPDDIVAVVCQVAARAYGYGAEDSGVQTETLGPYSVTGGAAAAQGGLGLLAGERAALDRYRKPLSYSTYGP